MSASPLESFHPRFIHRTSRFVNKQLDLPEKSGEFMLNTEVWIREISADLHEFVTLVAQCDTDDQPHVGRSFFMVAALIRVELDKAGPEAAREVLETIGRTLQFEKEFVNSALLLHFCLSLAHATYDHEAFLQLYRNALMEAHAKRPDMAHRFPETDLDD